MYDFQIWVHLMTVLCLTLLCKMRVRSCGNSCLPTLINFLWVSHALHCLYFSPELTSQSSQLSSGIPCPGETDPSLIDGSYISPPLPLQPLHPTPCPSPSPSLNSTLSLTSSPANDPPPIQNSPWTESSLDQPYQKSKKSHSSSKTR